jgi:hypothetical protein
MFMEVPMRTIHRLALLAALPLLACLLPSVASADSTIVVRDFTQTQSFPDDICGPRASTVTWTYTVAQSQLVERADGTFSYRDVSVVTYVVDFVDPALADYPGRDVEVNHYILTPGENNFLVTNTFHDFGGDLKIWERLNVKVVGGEVVVDRFVLEATGCP